MEFSQLIGVALFAVGLVLAINDRKKRNSVYHYGMANAKVVAKYSDRELCNAGHFEHVQGNATLQKMHEKILSLPPIDPQAKSENQLFPVYEYDFNGSPRKMQSYCESYTPIGESETIYLDAEGNVNDKYIKAGTSNGAEIIMAYGLSTMILSAGLTIASSLTRTAFHRTTLFVYFGAIGLTALIYSIYDTIRCAKFEKKEVEVVYNYCEASEHTDHDSDITTIQYSYFPVVHYQWENREIWQKLSVGTGKEYEKETINVRIDPDGVAHDSGSKIFFLIFGIFWVGCCIFMLF